MATSLPDLALESVSLIQLDQLYRIQAILNAFVINNILLVNTSGQSKTETFYNPNLYSLAVQFYGDDAYWTVIANANGLTDPKVSTGFVSLLIPPKPSIAPTGILSPTTQNS